MATSSIASSLQSQEVPGNPDSPHQPDSAFKFPKRAFGKTSVMHRSFQHSWFEKWPFLHYNEANDVAYCHTCLRMFKEKTAKTTTKADPAFVSIAILISDGYMIPVIASYM